MLKKIRQKWIHARFKRKGWKIIQNMPLAVASKILALYIDEGWEVAAEYRGLDALNMLGKCIIRRGQSSLTFLHNENTNASIIGTARIVGAIATQFDLEAYDSPQELPT